MSNFIHGISSFTYFNICSAARVLQAIKSREIQSSCSVVVDLMKRMWTMLSSETCEEYNHQTVEFIDSWVWFAAATADESVTYTVAGMFR